MSNTKVSDYMYANSFEKIATVRPSATAITKVAWL